MATFPSIDPTYGTSKKSSPKSRVVSFADGYEQRLVFGLPANQDPKTYSIKFEVSETDADTIETFLEARADDQDWFTWTPPGESSSGKYVCREWNKSIPYKNRASISATFREVFEP
tara:strand:+ start:230 stop:577 length:348 start_codon:yes stop_codon:yes gene_type:complete